MKFYFSGQDYVRSYIPETVIEDASAMLSFYTACILYSQKSKGKKSRDGKKKKRKISNRLTVLMKARREERRNEKALPLPRQKKIS